MPEKNRRGWGVKGEVSQGGKGGKRETKRRKKTEDEEKRGLMDWTGRKNRRRMKRGGRIRNVQNQSKGRRMKSQREGKRGSSTRQRERGKQSIGICRNRGGIWTKKRRRKGRRRGRKWNKNASYTMLQTRTDELNINMCYKGSMRACSFVNFCAYGGITSPFKISCSESFHLW